MKGAFKGRFPIKMFRSKCQQVYSNWLKQQPEPIFEKLQLKFSKFWIQDWMKEYNFSIICNQKRKSCHQNKRLLTKYLDSKKVFSRYLTT